MKNNKLFVGVLSIVCLPMLYGCEEPAPPPEPGRISGQVTNWLNDAPVDGAVVTALIESTYETKSDKEGHFLLSELPPRDALLSVHASGYKPFQVAVKTDWVTYTTEESEPEGFQLFGDDEEKEAAKNTEWAQPLVRERILDTVAQIRLIPVVRLDGTVLLDGEPVTGAVITVRCNGKLLAEDETKEDGTYELENIELCVVNDLLGLYQVSAQVDLNGDGVIDHFEEKYLPATPSKLTPTVFSFETVVDPGVVGTEIFGHVFSQSGTPVAGNTVLLQSEFGAVLSTATTSVNGSFRFQQPIHVGEQFSIIAMPADIDGDGWVDTGATQQTVSRFTNWSNVVLTLPLRSYTLAASNACGLESNSRLLLPDEPIYLLFNTSVNPELTQVALINQAGQEIPASQEWTGSYLLTITPENTLATTVHPGEAYQVQFQSLVFQDGHVELSPTDTDEESCFFFVGDVPTYLESPLPVAGTNITSSGESAPTFDEDGWFANGTSINQSAPLLLEEVRLSWMHVAGASAYRVYGRQSHPLPGRTENEWRFVGSTSANPDPNGKINATVDLGSGFDGGNGRPLSFSNEIHVIVKSVDEAGHEPPITGEEPILRIADQTAPGIVTYSGGTGLGFFPDGSRGLIDFGVRFSENMDATRPLSVEQLSPLGGRIKSIPSVNSASWSLPSGEAYASVANFSDVAFEFKTGAELAVTGGDQTSVLTSAEFTGALDGYAIGQNIGLYKNDTGNERVIYTTVFGLNTSFRSIQLSAFNGLPGTGDVIFDPCASRTLLTKEALRGDDQLQVASSAKFRIGQELNIGFLSGGENRRITGVSGNSLNLNAPLSTTQETGSLVFDPECYSNSGVSSFTLRNEGVRTLSALSLERFVGPTEIQTSTVQLNFTSSVNLSAIATGDRILIDSDGDVTTLGDQVIATVTGITTIDGAGNSLEDNAGNLVRRINVSNVQPVGTNTLPMVIDPTEALVRVYFDGIRIGAGDMTDTSGNGPISEARGADAWLNSNGDVVRVTAGN